MTPRVRSSTDLLRAQQRTAFYHRERDQWRAIAITEGAVLLCALVALAWLRMAG